MHISPWSVLDTGLFPPVSVSRPPSTRETSLRLKRHLLRCRCGRSRCRRPPRLRHLRRQDDLRAARVPPRAPTAPAVPAASLADVELLLVTVVVEPRVITTVLRAFSGGQAVLVPHIVVRFTVKPVPGAYLSVWKKPRVCTGLTEAQTQISETKHMPLINGKRKAISQLYTLKS